MTAITNNNKKQKSVKPIKIVNIVNKAFFKEGWDRKNDSYCRF